MNDVVWFINDNAPALALASILVGAGGMVLLGLPGILNEAFTRALGWWRAER